MRTTLNLDPDIAAAAKALAAHEGRSLGAVISELARKGLQPQRIASSSTSGFPVFDVAPDTPVITDEMVAKALDDE